MKVQINKSEGRYNLLSSEKTWSLSITVYEGNDLILRLSETIFEEEPFIEWNEPPSEIARRIMEEKARWITSGDTKQKMVETYAKLTSMADAIDQAWAESQIKDFQWKIDILKKDYSA